MATYHRHYYLSGLTPLQKKLYAPKTVGKRVWFTLYEAEQELLRLKDLMSMENVMVCIGNNLCKTHRFVLFFSEWEKEVRPAWQANKSERIALHPKFGRAS